MANTYSKSVLIVTANMLLQQFPEVDYFPGYEIVMSAGPECYQQDSIHVRDDIVELVTSFMIEKYAK